MRLESATPQRDFAASKMDEAAAWNAVAKRGSPERPVTRRTCVAGAACDTAGDAPAPMAVTTATAHHPLPTTHSRLTRAPAIAGSPTPPRAGAPAPGTPPARPPPPPPSAGTPTPHRAGSPAAGTPPACPTDRATPGP